MPNDYFTKSGSPSTSSSGASAVVRGEFSSIEAAFDKLAPLAAHGGEFVRINTGATAQESVSAATARSALGLAIGTNVQAWDADLDALAALAATAGMVARTGAGAFVARTLTGTANEITITNGDGAAGAPTLSLPAALTFTGKTVAGGTFTNPTLTNEANTTQALTDAATVAWNMNSGAFATLTATGAVGNTRAVGAPTNIKVGGRYRLDYTEDVTGGRAITFNAVFKGANGAAMPDCVPTSDTTTSFIWDSPDGVNLILAWSRIGNIQVFAGNGTYTPTAGMRGCKVTVGGGGGGSGGTSATDASHFSAAGGAGAGGGAIKFVSAATVGASQAVTVGAGGTAGVGASTGGGNGGTTSFGAIVSATGGIGSGLAAASTNYIGGSFGAGGTGSGGDINFTGGDGTIGTGIVSLSQALGGNGGNGIFGGGACGVSGGGAAGTPGHTYSAGAGGGANAPSTSQQNGAAGAGGVVFVEEFF